MIMKEQLPVAGKLEEGATPNERNEPDVYGEATARIPHNCGVMYGDWRYIDPRNSSSWSLRLMQLTESLLGTVLRYGAPMHLEWIVNLDNETQDAFFEETIGWKGLFAKEVGPTSAASTIAMLEEAGEKWRAKNLEIVKKLVLDKCVEAIKKVLGEVEA